MSINDPLENINEIEKEEEDDNEILKNNKKKFSLFRKDNQREFNFIREIRFIPRTELTNTHRNIVDDHIESISTWEINKIRKILTIIGYFLSFGILFIITLYDKTFILKLYCDRANPEKSNYVLITDYDNKQYLCILVSQILTNINPIFKMAHKGESKTLGIPSNSRYINKNGEKRTDMQNIYFIFKNVRYIYNSSSCSFSSAYFNLNLYKNNEILQLFDKKYSYNVRDSTRISVNKEISLEEEENDSVYSPSFPEYNYLLNKYGENLIVNESTKLTSIIFNQLFSGFNYFSIICEIIWFIIGYRIFAVIIFLFTLFVLVKSIYDSYILNRRIYELDREDATINENNNEDNNYNTNKKTNETNQTNLNSNYNNTTKTNNYNDYKQNLLYKENENCNINKATSIRQINPELSDMIEDIDQMWSIVPGEVIKIKPGHKILFDGIILNGYCTVDESELTGETNEIYKTQLPNDNEYFQYLNSRNHFLFQGTIIKQCTNDNNNDIIRVLVINTGMNTHRANLLLNLSFPKQGNYSFYKDILIFMCIMFFIFLLATIFNINLKLGLHYYLSDITIILSPILIISLTISSSYYKSYLQKNDVHCVDKDKIIAAGKANVIAFDKTGTLTENEFDLYGYQFTMPEEFSDTLYNSGIQEKKNNDNINHNRTIKTGNIINTTSTIISNMNTFNFNNNRNIQEKKKAKIVKYNYDDEQNTVLSKLETSSKVLNKIHQIFWKNFSISTGDLYKEDPKYNIIYFAECLGCCHNIEKFEDKNLGDAIDIKMFESVNWMIQIEEDKTTNEIKRYIMPSNIYKITEKSFFNNLRYNLDKNKKHKHMPLSTLSQYKILIEKIYPFNSENQTTTVITKNILDKSRRIYIKGAPEKLLEKCTASSKPENINALIMDLTKQGLRVIACATRLLDQEKEEYKDNSHKKANSNSINMGYYRTMPSSRTFSVYEKEINPIEKESNLTFLGLIIFRNPLKKDTQSVIEKLYKAKFKLVMSTGDNECTSYYVAQESKMINAEIHSRYVIDIKLDTNLLYMIEIKSNNDYENENKLDMNENEQIPIDNLLNKPKDDYLENNNCLDQVDKILLKKEAIVSVSGSALSYIIEQLRNDSSDIYIDFNRKCTKKNIENLIRKFGCIFYRMTPRNKAELMQFFKQDKKSIVIMCGDGSNDVPAILEADIGVSINQESNMQILSHFYMKNTSIECVESIVKTGRACFECNEMLFKVMVIQGSLFTLCKKLIQFLKHDDFNQIHILFIEIVCSLIPLICSVRTSPALILAKEAIGTSLFNKKFFISTITQLILNLGALISFFFYLGKFVDYENILNSSGKDIVFISYMFIFICFQYLLAIFVFNYKSVHRKHFSTNSIFIIVLLLILNMNLQFIYFSDNKLLSKITGIIEFEDSNETFEYYLELNKLSVHCFIILDLILSMIIELFIVTRL